MAITKKSTKKKNVVKPKIRVNSFSKAPPLTKQEKIWEAESDARILARAEDVKKDKSRLKAAKVQAMRMARATEIELQSMRKIAR